ncbi:MAG: aldehyde dehydrogenase family protein [Leptospiraceae bacterium]|nr:aldehyde dehydrogenase family protein [Leptospiraceae bacterium]MCP5512516.1 aldehyde dehydrogenase family protein [Leptospiraceae bacterium]
MLRTKRSNHSVKFFHKTFDPFTGRPFALYPLSDQKKILKTIYRANINLRDEFYQSTEYRFKLLYKIRKQFFLHRKEFIQILCKESGKPIRYAESEFRYSLDLFRLAAEELSQRENYHLKDRFFEEKNFLSTERTIAPGNLVLALLSYQFPLSSLVKCLVSTIVSGSSLIVKPSYKAPGISFLMRKIVLETLNSPSFQKHHSADFFKILLPLKIELPYLMNHPAIHKIFFSGKPSTLNKIKKNYPERLYLVDETSSSIAILDHFINIQKAAEIVSEGITAFSGQSKYPIKRVYVHEDIYSDFKSILVEILQSYNPGTPFDQDTIQGPLLSRSMRDNYLTYLTISKRKGMEILCGDRFSGNYLYPSILENNQSIETDDFTPPMGPIAILEPFTSFEDLVRRKIRNRTSVSLFSENIRTIKTVHDLMKEGNLLVNKIPTFLHEPPSSNRRVYLSGLIHSFYGEKTLLLKKEIYTSSQY